MDAAEVAYRIKLARAYARIGQDELAAMLGVSTSTLGRWEKEQKKPPNGQLIAITEICQVRKDWFTAEDLGFGPPSTDADDAADAAEGPDA